MSIIFKVTEGLFSAAYAAKRGAKSVVRSTKNVAVSSARGAKSVVRSAKHDVVAGYRKARRDSVPAIPYHVAEDYEVQSGINEAIDHSDAEACFAYCEGDPS